MPRTRPPAGDEISAARRRSDCLGIPQVTMALLLAVALVASAPLHATIAIDVQASETQLLVGDPLILTVAVSNESSPTESDLTLRTFFVVPDAPGSSNDPRASATFTASLPVGCIAITTNGFGQGAIDCPINNLAPGSSFTFDLSIQTTADSRGQLSPQTLLVRADQSFVTEGGGVVLDNEFVDVAADTLTDRDNDGVSDFNEILEGTDPDRDTDTPGQSTIDVLSLVSPGAAAVAGGDLATRLNHLFAYTNMVFADSGVAITLRNVDTQEVAADDTQTLNTLLFRMTNAGRGLGEGDVGAFGNLNAMRDAVGADIVLLFAPSLLNSPICGLANLLAVEREGDLGIGSPIDDDLFLDKAAALGTVYIDCRDSVTAHEVGHILGTAHDRLDTSAVPGTFVFSRGHGVTDSFATVMGLVSNYGQAADEIDLFSDPALDCAGSPCGIDSESPNAAHATRSLNTVRHQLAAMKPTIVPQGELAGAIDIDGNGSAEPLVDGILVLRYAFNFRGATLIDGALGSGATRTTAAAIEAHIANSLADFDVDGNGSTDPLSDALLILRVLFGFSGDSVTNGALGAGATRTSSTEISAYIDQLRPE